MPLNKSAAIEVHFADLTDPRRREGTYPLINIVVIAVFAVICGTAAQLRCGEQQIGHSHGDRLGCSLLSQGFWSLC